MDHRPSAELLAESHEFPGVYQFKVIGNADGNFEGRVLAAVASEIGDLTEFHHSVRSTPDGRHVSVTLHVPVQTPEQVRSLYTRIQALEGLRMVL